MLVFVSFGMLDKFYAVNTVIMDATIIKVRFYYVSPTNMAVAKKILGCELKHRPHSVSFYRPVPKF